MTFGERLGELAEENGFTTRKQLADRLGIPSTTLRNYEKGSREPGHSFLKQVSQLFNVSVDYLLGLTDEKETLKNFRVNKAEQALIEYYRDIDDFGKETIQYAIKRELQRTELIKSQKDRIAELEATPIVVEKQNNSVLRMYTYLHKVACAGNGFYFDDIPTDSIEAPYQEGADFIIGVSGDSMEPTFKDGDLVYVQKQQTVEIGDIGVFFYNNECFIKEAGEGGLISHNKKYKIIPGSERIQCIGKVLGKVFQ